MNFVSKSLKLRPILSSLKLCSASVSTGYGFNSYPEPVRQVFISQSSNIFTNLALENWLYQHHDFEHKHLLLLWRSDACSGMRVSAGQPVDKRVFGDINCTFFTQKSDELKRTNYHIVCSAIQSVTGLDVYFDQEKGIYLKNKLPPTLGFEDEFIMLNNGNKIHECLDEDKATQTVRVPLSALRRSDPSIEPDRLEEVIGWQFLRTRSDGEDEGIEGARRQRGFQKIRPEEGWFKGINQLRKQITTNSWIFEKTDKHTIYKNFVIPEDLLLGTSGNPKEISIEIELDDDIIKSVRTKVPRGLLDPEFDFSNVLHGLTFDKDLPKAVDEILGYTQNLALEKKVFISNCMRQLVGDK